MAKEICRSLMSDAVNIYDQWKSSVTGLFTGEPPENEFTKMQNSLAMSNFSGNRKDRLRRIVIAAERTWQSRGALRFPSGQFHNQILDELVEEIAAECPF